MLGLTLQMIRIAMMRFEAAAGYELGDAAEAPELQGAASQTKGWGLLMSGRPREAESYFERARADYDPSSTDRSYLYLMNISALNQARLGNIAAALDWEQKIEAKLDELERPDWQLRYVNALNHARLYKVTGDYGRSEAYYQRAFSINDGIRRPTDYVYFNFTLAQLCDQRHAAAESVPYWLRAAMHWLSCTLPEALAPRMAGAILGRVSYRDVDDMEEIAQALCHGLSRSARAAGLPTEASSMPRICFKALETPRGGRFDAAIGAEGWSCLVDTTESQPALDGEAYRQLNALTLCLIQSLQPRYQLPSNGTLWLDRQTGREIPVDLAELVASAMRREVDDIYWGDAHERVSIPERKAFESQCRVSLGAGVDRLESVTSPAGALTVCFRRFLAPQLLSDSEGALVRSIGAGKSLPNLADELQMTVPDLERQVRALEDSHILRCTVPSVQTS
jgi:tetratricopeptide (TPR) repeat protein